jgi:signal transduction histidine kinase
MELQRRSALIYGLLLVVWLLVVGWQIEEHARVEAAAKTDLQNRSTGIANTLSAVVRALRFRGTLLQDRLQPVLDDMVNSGTNGLPGFTELLSVALINTDGKPIVSAGDTNLIPGEALSESEPVWTADSVTFVNPVWGASASPENSSNPIVVLPSFREMSNSIPRDAFERRGSNEMNFSNPPSSVAGGAGASPPPGQQSRDREGAVPGTPPGMEGPRNGGPRRPPWLRWMDENQFKALTARRELHGLVLAMSTENVRAVSMDDLWLRGIIVLFAGISAIVAGLAWRNVSKTSELQIRLVRASELNSHLKEMNLAAAGLAHETRNPLNIIRGMAQMISKSDATADLREKSKAIVDETDKVTAQLNEFINYSRPREVRRAKTALNAVVTEVVRALNYDIDEKKIRVESKVEPFLIEADEQLLRQALFNLLLNSIQAVGENGQILFTAHRNGSEAMFEIRDDGPGVPPEQRREIFKPYFTTHQKGTGLGLAVVQQIVLAHGWEIECLANDPKGAVFRISHLKPTA